jgi:hypothetical protein
VEGDGRGPAVALRRRRACRRYTVVVPINNGGDENSYFFSTLLLSTSVPFYSFFIVWTDSVLFLPVTVLWVVFGYGTWWWWW